MNRPQELWFNECLRRQAVQLEDLALHTFQKDDEWKDAQKELTRIYLECAQIMRDEMILRVTTDQPTSSAT